MSERAYCDHCGQDFEVNPEYPSPDGEACNRCDEGNIVTYDSETGVNSFNYEVDWDPCPDCGAYGRENCGKGEVYCAECGHDFAADLKAEPDTE